MGDYYKGICDSSPIFFILTERKVKMIGYN